MKNVKVIYSNRSNNKNADDLIEIAFTDKAIEIIKDGIETKTLKSVSSKLVVMNSEFKYIRIKMCIFFVSVTFRYKNISYYAEVDYSAIVK